MADELSVIFVDNEALTVTIVEDSLTITVTEMIDFGSGGTDHTVLLNRSSADQHPMSAITGLVASLTSKEIAGVAASLDATHIAAADPHIVYVLETELDALTTVIISNDVVVAANTAHAAGDGSDHSDVAANTAHAAGDGKDHSDVVLNNTHRSSDGKDHSDVVLNNAHRISDGSSHSLITAAAAHIISDGKNHSDVVLNNAHRISDGTGHTFIDQDVKTTATPTFAGIKHTPTDTPANEAGETRYGLTDPSLYISDGTTELDIVFGTPIKVVNGNGTAITKGQVVNITNVDSDLPEVVLAIASETDISGFVPGIVVSTSISDGSTGYVLHMGMVNGLNTASLVEGNIVYLDGGVAGGLTTTKPVLPYRLIRIGICTFSHVSLGKIFVAPQSESDELYDLRMIQEDRQEPQGFIRKSPLTMGDISFVDGTRTFSIAPQGGQPNFQVYCSTGGKYTKTGQEDIIISDIDGLHIIYYDLDGVLQESTTWDDDFIELYAIVATIYWNVSSNYSLLLGDERHGISMSGATHEYLHDTRGSRYASGLGINGLADGTSGYTSTDSGEFFDEDIEHEVAASNIHQHVYKLGASDLWYKTAADGNLAHDGGGNAYYNEWTGAIWQLTPLSGGQFGLVHFVATNDSTISIMKITGEHSYANRAAARAAIQTEIAEITVGGMIAAEFIFLYSMIITSNGDLEDLADGSLFVDFRGATIAGAAGASGTTTYHVDLLDTDTDGHPVTAITGLVHKESFVDADLAAGILTVTHSLNSEYPSAVTVWDNNGKIVEPDDIESTGVNTLTVDLSSYGTLTGTWNVSITY